MQRVVRSTLVGLLTVAGLTACGDKVTIPPVPTTLPTTVVHSVTVSPSAASINVGGTFTFAASVDADAGVSNRTVTWSSSDNSVASVSSAGVVTGVKAGTVSIKATSVADPSVSGAAALTVGAGPTTGSMSIQIVGVRQTNAAGQSVPANVLGAAGQLDVDVNVDPAGQTLKSVSVTVKNAATGDSLIQTQTFTSDVAALGGEATNSLLTFSFNTAGFYTGTTGTNPCNPGLPIPASAVNGKPCITNGPVTITARATSTTTTTPAATSTVTYVLANLDAAIITNSFAPYTNAEGVTTITSATDPQGLTWKGGAPTISVVPVLYSGRTISSVSITLPGASTATQTLTAAPFSATWSATSTNVANVVRLTLVNPAFTTAGCPAGCEANGITPLPVVPSVVVLDAAGNDLGVIIANPTVTGAAFRLDNTPPEPPLNFEIAPRQSNWINAAYTFTGTGNGGGYSLTTGTAKYVACGDGGTTANGNGNGSYGSVSGGAGACATAIGVSAGAVGNNGGTNGNTTFTYYYIAAANYIPASSTNGTGVSSTACDKTGWTKITTGNDIPASVAGAYVVRVFESDKLLNARCTDIAKPTGAAVNINNGAFANGTFGVDKIAPAAVYVETATSVTCGLNPIPADPTAAGPNGIFNALGNNGSGGTVPNNFNVRVAICDDNTNNMSSGTSANPVTVMVQRLYVDPTTNAKSDFNTANGCPTGLNSSGVCTTTRVPASLSGWFGTLPGGVYTPGTAPGSNGGADASGCVGCGYYIFTQTPFDNAQNNAVSLGSNSATTLSVNNNATCGGAGCRQVLIDPIAPLMGGISVPATITGGTNVSFATNAQDNLDLLNYDYTLRIPIAASGNLVANLPIRSSLTTIPGAAAFDNTLTTLWTGALVVNNFIRDLNTTTAGNAPQNNPVLPDQITGRVYDAAGNPSAAVNQPINPVNIPQTGRVDFTAQQAGAAGTFMSTFAVTNAVTNISNGPATTTPANPTSVNLTAQIVATETAANPYINPFSVVQFYYQDPVTTEFILIGTANASTVTDNNTVTQRTVTFGLAWDPPASLGAVAPLRIIAIGITSLGDALVTQGNINITTTNP